MCIDKIETIGEVGMDKVEEMMDIRMEIISIIKGRMVIISTRSRPNSPFKDLETEVNRPSHLQLI